MKGVCKHVDKKRNESHLIPHVGVGRGHVHLKPERRGAFVKLTRPHLLEQIQAFL